MATVETKVALLLLVFGANGGSAVGNGRLEDALDRTLTYIFENNNHINLDGLFGVVMAQAHLDAILDRDLPPGDREQIQRLKSKADIIYGVIKPQLYAGNEDQIMFLEEVADPQLWLRQIEFRQGLVSPAPPPLAAAADTYDAFVSYLRSSNMTETQSDECLLQLVASGSRTARHDCRPSAACRRHMVDEPRFDPAYGITHRLLYLQVARARLCAMDGEWYHGQTARYCSYILWEAAMNANFGFIDNLDDLLFEQMTLCGYEGFAEFLSPEFVERVLDAQTAHGCYGIPMLGGGKETRRNARSANVISYGCNDHATGLGAATLALALRYQKTGLN